MNKMIKDILTPGSRASNVTTITIVATILTLYKLGILRETLIVLDQPQYHITVDGYTFSLFDAIRATIRTIMMIWVMRIILTLGSRTILNLEKLNKSTRILLSQAFKGVMFFIIALIVTDILGVDLTALAVLGGAISIGVGFGMKKITSNIIAGYVVLLEKNIEEGDVIEKHDGVTGTVKKISARYTLLETRNGSEITIPNEYFLANSIINWTHSNNQRRISLKIPVSPNSNLEHTHKIILDSIINHPSCSDTTAPTCRLVKLSDSAEFIVNFWVDDIKTGTGRVQHEILFSIWRDLNKNEIKIYSFAGK